MMRLQRVAAVIALCVVFESNHVHATPEGTGHSGDAIAVLVKGMVAAAWLVEAAVPDMRYEFVASGEDGWVMSFPVHVVDRRFNWTHTSLFVEPQLRRTGENQTRMLAGGRIGFYPLSRYSADGFPGLPGITLEAGGLAGHDGNGGFAGVGLSFDILHMGRNDNHERFLPNVSVVYRRVFTNGGRRSDVALDLMLISLVNMSWL